MKRIAAVLSLALLSACLALPIAAQTAPLPAAPVTALPALPPAFLAGFGGYDSTQKAFGGVAYAHQTGADAGTGKPIYSYTEIATYKFGDATGKTFQQATQVTTGAMLVFYDKALFTNYRASLAVVGSVGVSTTPGSTGYVLGSQVVGRFAKIGSKWGLFGSANPTHVSAGGVSANHVAFGINYAFGGF